MGVEAILIQLGVNIDAWAKSRQARARTLDKSEDMKTIGLDGRKGYLAKYKAGNQGALFHGLVLDTTEGYEVASFET